MDHYLPTTLSNEGGNSLIQNNTDPSVSRESSRDNVHGACMNKSIQFLPLSGHEKQWQLAEFLKERLDSLNKLVKRRESLIHAVPGIVNSSLSSDNENKWTEHQQEESNDNSHAKLGFPHILSEKNPDLPQTDASKRLTLRFENFREEIDISRGDTHKIRKQGSNRIIVKGHEKRKKTIRTIEKQLESNSSKYLSRAANSIRFHVKKVPSDGALDKRQNMIDFEEYPIPLGGFEMNPDLLLSLSCEKMALDRGRGLLKSVSLNSISLDLFVYMYWFIHCRFFQVCIMHCVYERFDVNIFFW